MRFELLLLYSATAATLFFCDGAMATAITSLKLVTTKGADIGPLQNGDVLALDNMPTSSSNWTIVAVSSGIVKSVRFLLNDTHFRLENKKPYSLNGDYLGGHYAWNPVPLGAHRLTVIPYTLTNAAGMVGTVMQVTFTVVPTLAMAAPATPSPTAAPIPLYESSNGVFPLGRCQGECFHDDDCEMHLHCFHRSGLEAVPSCAGLGVAGRGYCARIISTPGGANVVTYVPGLLGNVYQNGLELSQGLLSRAIAVSGEPVKFDTGGAIGGGGNSSSAPVAFHIYPDGAAVFSRPETDGWVYVSNSEDWEDGGVGAIYFDSHGRVNGYSRLLSGMTSRNCGGCKTFWNTFLTCEEHDLGQVWEVDPWGSFPPHVTVVGKRPMNYESIAYDNRNVSRPRFYATVDEYDGPLLRFTPDPQNVSLALANGDWTNFLKLPAGPGAKWQYLVLNYTSGTKSGTYSWTSNITQGWASAYAHFQNIEGIDIFNGMLYMTAKWNQQLFILDLDKRTFVESSTASGAFADQPDQIARLVDDDGILYFCEDADSGSGVHGRNSAGQYFTILQADTNYATNGGVVMLGETSGLAFSPDRMFMYVSYQYKGKIIEVRRADGLPFNGRRLDIKYHSV